MTNDLRRRLSEHKSERGNPGTFAGRYYCYRLIYYECYRRAWQAIDREKEVKKWRREKKEALIETLNPDWKFLDTTEDFIFGIDY